MPKRLLVISIGGGFGLPNTIDVPDYISKSEVLPIFDGCIMTSIPTKEPGKVSSAEWHEISEAITKYEPSEVVIAHAFPGVELTAKGLAKILAIHHELPIVVFGPEEDDMEFYANPDFAPVFFANALALIANSQKCVSYTYGSGHIAQVQYPTSSPYYAQ